jgi:hypothetical protein
MSPRLDIASRILAAIVADGGEGFHVDQESREAWVSYSLAWADELIKQGEKND